MSVNAVVVSASPSLTAGDKSTLYVNESGELLVAGAGGGGGGGTVDQGAAGAAPWLVTDAALDVALSSVATEATLATLATEATLSAINGTLDTPLSDLATEATLSAMNTKIPASPAQDRTAAASPHAVRLSDGSAFLDPRDVRVAGTAVSNANPMPVSDAGSSLTVDGVVTANIGTTGGLSLEHVTAASPHASRLSDGAAFYKAAVAGDNMGADLRVGGSSVANGNPVPVSDAGGSLTIDGSVTANVGTTGGLALDATLTGGTQVAIAKGPVAPGAAVGAEKPLLLGGTDGTNAQMVNVDSTGAVRLQSGGTTGAVAPSRATQVGGTDGTNLRALRTDTNGRLDANLYMGGTAVSNTNPVFIVPQNKATFIAYSPNTALGNNKSMLSVFLASGGSATRLSLIDVVVLNTQATNVAGVIATLLLYRITTSAPTGGTDLTASVVKYDTNDTLDAAVTAMTGATALTEEANFFRKWVVATDEYTVGALETESFQASLDNIFPSYTYDPRVRPITARVNQGFHIRCATNTTSGTFDVGFVFTTE
jgi:hypothetical protein